MINIVKAAKLSLSAAMLVLTTSQLSATPELSKDKAMETATTFCQSINSMSLTAAADQTSDRSEATPAKTELINPDARHRHLRWKVTLSNHNQILINADTGLVDEYHNEAFYANPNSSLAGQAIPKSDAIQRAGKVLAAAGASVSNLALDDAWERQDGTRSRNEGKASGHQWMLWWRRTYKGVPFRDQYALVQLQAETGEVVQFGAGFDLLPPPSIEENVTREQAVAIGQTQLAVAGVRGMSLSWVRKMIIQPDTFWQDGNQHSVSNSTRMAWLCGFGAPDNTYGVWVDTATGDVIGGTLGGTLGGGLVNRQKPIFGHQLRQGVVRAKTAK